MKFDQQIDFKNTRLILDVLPMGLYVLNGERKIQWVNRRAAHWFQKKNIPYYNKTCCYKVLFKQKEPCSNCPVLRTINSGRMEHAEIKSEYDGETKYYYVTATPLQKEQSDKGMLIIETVQDITNYKKAEEDLRRLNDFNAAIIDNAPVAIFTIDRTGQFISVNPALATLSGLGAEVEDKLLGFNWIENPYTIRCGLADCIKKGLEGEPFELYDFPFTTYRGDRGHYIHFRGVPLKGKDGKVEGLLCIIEDTSEKVMARIQSIQDAKVSVIGRLMTGVAHELNNPLAAIAANSELACELFQNIKNDMIGKAEINELREYLEVIEEQAFRCKNIIKDMIDITKKEDFEVQEVDLHSLLNELFEVLNLKKLKIRLIKELAGSLPHIKGDVSALKQCFLNILRNAADALEGREGAAIRLGAKADGNFVRVEIEDNGIGIHDGLVDKIFEPFFSTKETGKGIGLGLTLCYEFLKKMGAKIDVESKLGRGSLFVIKLPVFQVINDGG
jgi:PAS domain S-box-containing protein